MDHGKNCLEIQRTYLVDDLFLAKRVARKGTLSLDDFHWGLWVDPKIAFLGADAAVAAGHFSNFWGFDLKDKGATMAIPSVRLDGNVSWLCHGARYLLREWAG